MEHYKIPTKLKTMAGNFGFLMLLEQQVKKSIKILERLIGLDNYEYVKLLLLYPFLTVNEQ